MAVTASKCLSLADFATLFGCTQQDLPETTRALIEAGDWRYEMMTGAARDRVVVDLLKRIDRREFSIVKFGDRSRWLRGWDESLNDYVAAGGDVTALVPRYIRPGVPMRLFGDFVMPASADFELRWYQVFRDWLLRSYFGNVSHIFEFGSGSGFNVAELARLYPKAEIIGLDWVEPSVEIVERLRADHGLRTKGRLFDFFEPDRQLDMPPNSAVLTIGALEQTGERNQAFLDFLIAKRPRLCVHVEPIVDWYDPESLVDHLAIRIHEARNFWHGWPRRLQALAAEGRVEIVKMKRAFVGSLLLEGYSQLIWRPIGSEVT